MWRAAGGDASKRPVIWLRQEAAQQFIGYIADSLKVTDNHLLEMETGGSGSTWAHWQVGMAYAPCRWSGLQKGPLRCAACVADAFRGGGRLVGWGMVTQGRLVVRFLVGRAVGSDVPTRVRTKVTPRFMPQCQH
jgi:hypothetical protein